MKMNGETVIGIWIILSYLVPADPGGRESSSETDARRIPLVSCSIG